MAACAHMHERTELSGENTINKQTLCGKIIAVCTISSHNSPAGVPWLVAPELYWSTVGAGCSTASLELPEQEQCDIQ